jgi:hypothetical protein
MEFLVLQTSHKWIVRKVNRIVMTGGSTAFRSKINSAHASSVQLLYMPVLYLIAYWVRVGYVHIYKLDDCTMIKYLLLCMKTCEITLRILHQIWLCYNLNRNFYFKIYPMYCIWSIQERVEEPNVNSSLNSAFISH